MKKIAAIATIFVILLSLSSCSSNTVDIKSPCVARDGGPCGPKKPLNEWWLKNTQQHKTNS